MKGTEIIKKLRENGWELDRIKGSHHIMKKGKQIVPVPVHGTKDIPTGTLKSIEKQTGVKLS